MSAIPDRLASATLAAEASAFWRVGLLSFGGPAAQIAVMHRVFVKERGWLDEDRFAHALSFCMILPGPEAMQLATYVGWLRHGWRGGLLAGLAFVLPGLAMILALSALFWLHGDVPAVEGVLFGLQAAVLAVVAEALVKVSKRALSGAWAVGLAVAAFVAIALLAVPFPLVVMGAALLGSARHALRGGSVRTPAAPAPAPPVVRATDAPWPVGAHAVRASDAAPAAGEGAPAALVPGTLATLAIWGGVWIVPGLLLWIALGDTVLPRMALFFSQAAVVTFGGAYAVLAYVAQAAVETLGWLRPGEMLTGLGLAETTLGPLVLVLVFVGFMGGARGAGVEPLLGGLAGGLTAAWFTFAPCFLWVFLGAPFMERLRSVEWLRAALASVTAAVVGVIASLGLWFALRVLWGEPGKARSGPLVLPVPEWSAFDPWAALIAAAAGVALIRFHANILVVLWMAAVAGLALRLV